MSDMLNGGDLKVLTEFVEKHPWISIGITVCVALALCVVLSSCEPHQDQKSSPENPGNPNDTITVTIPSGPSYFQAKHNFSK